MTRFTRCQIRPTCAARTGLVERTGRRRATRASGNPVAGANGQVLAAMLGRDTVVLGAALALLAALWTGHATAQVPAPSASQGHGRLFPPQDLGLLEGPDRAKWQKPDQIMDMLGIAENSRVADIGAGAGWFTIRLARRVGPNGRVYAQDVQPQMLEAVRRRVSREDLLDRVELVRGEGSDPRLPTGALDAVLVVDVYPEVEDRLTFLRNLAAALQPSGRLGIVNYKPGEGGPGPAPLEGVRVSIADVEADARAAGLTILARDESLPYQYLLVLGPP